MKTLFRWAGSKKKIVNELVQHFKKQDIYVEPFLGGGSVLFNVLQENRYNQYLANDINVSVITFFKALQKDVYILLKQLNEIIVYYNKLETLQEKEAFYYETRKQFNKDKSNHVLFWFLMKVGFNGLYRENKQGQYNVPFGKKEKILIDSNYFIYISKLIQKVKFYNLDYQTFYETIQKENIFSYNDPPYSISQQYTAEKFCNVTFAEFMKQQSFNYVISDVDTKEANNIYKNFKKIYVKKIKRTFNATTKKIVTEVLFY